MNQNSVTIQALIFSLLMVAGGVLSLFGDVLFAAVLFSFSAVFSSTNIAWKDFSKFNKVILTVSTLVGVGSLMARIFLDFSQK